MLCSQKRVCKHRVLREGQLYHATRSYSRSHMPSLCLPSSMPGPSSPYNVIRHWRYQAGNGEERDITCFHRACLMHSHDMPCRHPRVPQRQMQNTGSGVPISTDSCCHQPALLTWSRTTNNSRPSSLFPHTAPVGPRLPGFPQIFPCCFPERLAQEQHKFQNFQPPPHGQ